ncbi:Cyclic pyranopterin monophosphate synthase accessory protein [Novipirellula aureliae]|uniref:cyclic pyranopterin monophosphate synthase n=2 Tax=Novipirellula aureliae TaxID=2527966 RepID=A0A5C6E1E9_9BACT|nr:Cyclic pyranopterin monophosphate synthase accessory protein [Novipirellula aureliae]
MVDVSAKSVTVREAVASAEVVMSPSTAAFIREGTTAKGDVLGIARIAAINAVKLTSQLIPLCHAIPIEAVSVEFNWKQTHASENRDVLQCLVTVRTSAKTGVEMEAMTGSSIAALTIYDMTKSLEKSIAIGPVVLERKSGGKSGDFSR